MLTRLKSWARRLKQGVVALYFAARDPATPRAVRVLALAVAAYALSPIDLIPDFVPILGYVDDLLIVPLGLWLVLHLLPPQVLAAARAQAAAISQRPRSQAAAVLIVGLWLLAGALLCAWAWRNLGLPG